ncbi:hypothetical protein POVWA2_017840 [Plasmodium ovale wallikeri]|uniref:Uncharacterized protein n=1 Tax=Plasmodium ovale wallikeri TaxID=864142 RepID=A0A1A8YPX1_PLAOA|nr:hypothetical protein POVWA1_017940 [Plasmodium ovale wallikeri]SBT34034.1 hypothetical protein POVWA2_017840 [Plasmodium ovale wallikeri]
MECIIIPNFCANYGRFYLFSLFFMYKVIFFLLFLYKFTTPSFYRCMHGWMNNCQKVSISSIQAHVNCKFIDHEKTCAQKNTGVLGA